LVWLVGILALLLWLRQTADAIRRTPPSPPPEPLEFKLVVKQFTRIHVGMTSEEVFSLLGPQRYVTFREPEIDDYERLIEAHPDRYPGQRYWAKWADPSDPSRWVAVLLVGGHVYHKLRHGV
jgi:hypothetical protein